MSDPDPATAYAALRDETAALLKLDASNLSLVEGLQLDLVSLLRLEVDSLQGAALAGEKTDLQRLAVAHGMLAKLLPTVSAPPAADNHDFSSAHAELTALLDGRLAALERNMARDPDGARAAFEQKLQRAIENNKSGTANATLDGLKPACGDARSDSDVPHPLLVALAAPAGGPPAGAPASPPMATSNQPPLPPRGEIPANYLRDSQPREPWRDHIDASGEIIAPWFRPYG